MIPVNAIADGPSAQAVEAGVIAAVVVVCLLVVAAVVVGYVFRQKLRMLCCKADVIKQVKVRMSMEMTNYATGCEVAKSSVYVDGGHGPLSAETKQSPTASAAAAAPAPAGGGGDLVAQARTKLRMALPPVFSGNWKRLFNRLDVDFRGGLDQTEFNSGLRRIARVNEFQLADVEVRLIFAAADNSTSGRLSCDDFVKFMDKQDSAPAASSPQQTDSSPMRSRRRGRRRARARPAAVRPPQQQQVAPVARPSPPVDDDDEDYVPVLPQAASPEQRKHGARRARRRGGVF